MLTIKPIKSNVPNGVYANYIGIDAGEEKIFREYVKEHRKGLVDNFCKSEIAQLCIVPVVYNHIAWSYAKKARKLAAKYKIELLRPLCKALEIVEAQYMKVLRQDLDEAHIWRIGSEADRFIAENTLEFAQFYYTVNNAFLQKMPNYPYDDLRTYAIMGMLVIRQVDIHNKKMDALVKNRTGKKQTSHQMQEMDKLHYILDAYAGEVGKFDYNNINVQNAMKVIENKIAEMDFEII